MVVSGCSGMMTRLMENTRTALLAAQTISFGEIEGVTSQYIKTKYNPMMGTLTGEAMEDRMPECS